MRRADIERSVDNALPPLLPTVPQAGFERELLIPEISIEGIVEFDCRHILTALGRNEAGDEFIAQSESNAVVVLE